MRKSLFFYDLSLVMATDKILELSDKISTGGNIWGRFCKNQKNVKNVSKKNLYCIVDDLEKIFFFRKQKVK